MSGTIIPAKDLSASAISFSDVRVLDSGGKSIYINRSTPDGQKVPLVVQTPEMYCPFGMTNWADKGPPSWSFELSFKDMEDRPNLARFAENLQALDTAVIEAGQKNSQAWFKKRYNNSEILRELYTPTFKTHEKYPSRMKVKVPVRDNEFTCEVFNAKGERIELEGLEMKGARVTAIIQCTGVWMAGPKFGVTWKLIQMVVVPPTSIKGFAFLSVDGDKISAGPEGGVPAAGGDFVMDGLDGAEVAVPDTDDDDDDNDADDGGDAAIDDLEPAPPAAKRGRRS